MSGLETDTIGGFNSLIKKQRKEPGEAIVSTVLFDDTCEVIHDRVPMDKVDNLLHRKFTGFEAEIVQHELDHLEGKLV